MQVKRILKKRESMLFIIYLIIFTLIAATSPGFFSIGNFMSIVMNNIILAVLTLGATIVIITAGIDVSIGSQLGVVAVITALVVVNHSANIFIAFLTGICCGLVL
jgi:ribose/xylose/arabinose/galactoside ABC-type transport system permease subunit